MSRFGDNNPDLNDMVDNITSHVEKRKKEGWRNLDILNELHESIAYMWNHVYHSLGVDKEEQPKEETE